METALAPPDGSPNPKVTNAVPREAVESWEQEWLAPGGTRSVGAGNRDRSEAPDPLRTAFQRDRDRIIHSTAFRRLKHKTQVFIAPDGDHYRTRLTHTLEVAQIARTIARALRLNEDLAEAIALGHDLGHTPFGHLGEDVIRDVMSIEYHHAAQSVRVVEVLERRPHGLNLTLEVRDGISNSSWNRGLPSTHEAFVVRYADRIAYLNHDVDDAIRAGLLSEDELPLSVARSLGSDSSERITSLVSDVVATSDVTGPCGEAGGVVMSRPTFEVMDELRSFMFERIYLGPPVARDMGVARRVLTCLLEQFRSAPVGAPEGLPADAGVPGDALDRRVIDYVASMTDRFAIRTYERLTGRTADLPSV